MIKAMDYNSGILYDFITYAEWPQEPELIVKRDELTAKKHVHSAKNALWSIVGSLTSSVPADVSQHINNRLGWQFAVGGNGKVVCILQDACIEIRSSKDDYFSVVGKFNVSKDPYPQWRKLAWSPDCGMLALSYSNGSVDFFDALGSKLFSIPSRSTSSADVSEALVAILFADTRTQKSQWSSEVILINYKGNLRSCFVSPTDGFQDCHMFSFSNHFCSGVTSAVYHSKYNVVVVSGSVAAPCSGDDGETYSATRCGIAVWRVLSDVPYYRLSLTLDEEKRMNKASPGLLKRIPSMIWYRGGKPDTILKICLSPEGTLLGAVHVSGALSIWEIPSLRLSKMWRLEEQPDFDAENTLHYGFATKKKNAGFGRDALKFHLADVNWWSEEAVILGRYSGSVSVSSVLNLKNLLGASLEWFESPPQVSAAYDKGFLVMECESEITTKRRSVSPEGNAVDAAENADDDGGETDDDDTIARKYARFAKTALYYVTDSDRFQPPRKKPKVLKKTFRLLCLKSTTPEELFARKLDNEEYGEAISLAQTYGLDCDLVYQRQWRNAEVSLASIQDYLSKIVKRSWVLHECLERVPKDIDSTRALLNYGLQGTDLEALISMGNGTDDERFTICDVQQVYEDIDDVRGDSLLKPREADEQKAREALIAQVDFAKLTLEQKQLCRTRQKLLKYLDRLATYEIMLGSPSVAHEYFDFKFFNKFRTQPSIEAALQFAHESNWQSVAAMFTYHGEETLPHRLAIIWNFPETMPPFAYRSLLPECGYGSDEPAVIPWEQETIREQDWVEAHFRRNEAGAGSSVYLYGANPLLEKYNCADVTGELLTSWYTERAVDIECHSRLVNHSLELVKLGMERNVQGLEKLHDDFVTMEVLVYECYIDDVITFECLQLMHKLDVIHLMMSTSTEGTFVKNVRRWLLPFLSRCEKHEPSSSQDLMERYLVSLATHDLTMCAKIFQNVGAELQDPIFSPMSVLVNMALSCIYACRDDCQLSSANVILECFPQRNSGVEAEEILGLHDKLDLLEKHLHATEILAKHDVNKPVAFVKNCQDNANEVKQLLTLLTRVSSRKNPMLDETQWKELLEDILELHEEVFQCVDVDLCVEIFAESLLCSGVKENINLAGGLLKCSKAASGADKEVTAFLLILPLANRISSERANRLVVSAAMEYFNSSASLSDPAMDLAKQCLLLVFEPNDDVLAELDLINALPVLNYFGVNLLPMQVRMRENRLDFVKQVFLTRPDAYTESQKLLSLAHLLRVGQDVRQWEEQVYILVASAAFQAKDYDASYVACQNLIAHKYSLGWEVCLDLGQCDLYKDVKARCQLLAFSEIYCSSDCLEKIVKIKHKLEKCLLQEKLQALIDLAGTLENTAQEQPNYSDATKASEGDHPFQKTKKLAAHLQQFTSETTKQVLSTVGKAEIFKHAVSWIRPLWHLKKSPDLEDFMDVNSGFGKLSCPEFYASLFPDALASPIMPKYDSYAPPQELDICLSIGLLILQLTLIEETELSSEKSTLSPKVLQQVAENLLPVDSVLGLAHLLVLDDPVLIDECFQKFPSSITSLQFAIYCFGLQVCHLAELLPKPELYVSSPKAVTRSALCYAQTRTTGKCDKKLAKYCELLLRYERLRADFVQGRLLRSLGKGVDVARFSRDDQYKRETVLGLIMTTEDKVYDTAIALARKYRVPLWEVYMSHLEYLFAEEDIGLGTVEGRVTSLGLLPVIFQEPQKFTARMLSKVHATLSGLDHARLLYYYSLLEQCNPADKVYHDNIILLRKLKAHGQGLDYKAMTVGQQDVLHLLSPVLTGSNVQSFARLSAQLVKCCKQTVEPNMIYRTWAVKLFFEGSRRDESASAPHEWVSRYNASKDYFDRLKPEDLVKFARETLFVERALDEIPDGTRKELLHRNLKYAKQELGKCKEQSKQRADWQQALDFFERALLHLEWMQSEHIATLKESDDVVLKPFVRALDLSLSCPERTKVLIYRCVLDGNSLEVLRQVIDMCPPELRGQPGEVVVDVLSVIQKHLRKQQSKHSDLLEDLDCIQVLQAIIDVVMAHIKLGGNLVSVQDIADQLQPLCADNSVAVSVKLRVIQMLEQLHPDGSEELEKLPLYKTQAIIAGSWPDLEVLPDRMKSDESREELIVELLSRCATLQQLNTLVDLLLCWSSLPSSCKSEPGENSWCKIMNRMLETTHDEDLDSVVDVMRKIEGNAELSIEVGFV